MAAAALHLLAVLAVVEGGSAFAGAGVSARGGPGAPPARCSRLLSPARASGWRMGAPDAGVDWSDQVIEAAKKKAVALVGFAPARSRCMSVCACPSAHPRGTRERARARTQAYVYVLCLSIYNRALMEKGRQKGTW